MKKIKNILLITLTIFLITGCGTKKTSNKTNEVDYKDSLKNIMYNKTKFINENKETVYLKNTKLVTGEKVKPEYYALVDLDEDNEVELIIKTDSQTHDYMVFDNDAGQIYGYIIQLRSLLNLKEDGTFMASNSAVSHTYDKLEFDKTLYSYKQEAEIDETNNVYKIGNENVSSEEALKYEDEFNKKTDAKFIKY